MDPLTLTIVAGGLLLLLAGRKPVTQQQPPSAPPANTGGGASSGAGAADLGALGLGAAVAGALGGATAQYFADNHTTGFGGGQGAASTVATPVGVGIGAGAYLGLGGISGAAAIAGGSVVTGLALIIVPSVVLIAIVLSYVQIFENQAKMRRFTELYELVHAKIGAGDWAGAWKVAADAAEKEQLPGLGFTTTAKAAIPATLPLKDGSKLDVPATLKAAYAQSESLGDQYAAAINAAIPWMCNLTISGGQKVIKPNGAVRYHFNPYAKAQHQADVTAFINSAAYQDFKAELEKDLQDDEIDKKKGQDTYE